MLLSIGSFPLVLGVLVAQAAPSVSPSPIPMSTPVTAPATGTSSALPAHTLVKVHLTSLLSSHDAQTGQKFSFVVDQDVLANGAVAIARCTTGTGTVTLAGKHGINGHEGDLHLRFDALTPADGVAIPLDNTEQQFEGKERKTMAFFTTRWINGDDIEIKTDQILTVALAKDSAAPTVAPSACP
jgi:hypothetical protein